MRSRKAKLKPETFPFLAVLLCAMGALILLLLVMDRRAKIVARNKARLQYAQRLQDAAQDQARLSAEEQRRRLRWAELNRIAAAQLAQLQEVHGRAATVEQALRDERARQGQLLQQAQKAGDRVAQLRADVAERKHGIFLVENKAEGARSELVKQLTRVRELEATLNDLKARRSLDQQTYSLIPYAGKHGDNRKPIYIECGTSLIFHPDRLKALPSPLTVRAEVQRRIAQQRGDGKAATPYLMVLIRPVGIPTYGLLRAALEGLEIDFGYELIEDDWILDFSQEALAAGVPPVPPSLALAVPPIPKRVATLSMGGSSLAGPAGGGGQIAGGSGGGGVGVGSGVRAGGGQGIGPSTTVGGSGWGGSGGGKPGGGPGNATGGSGKGVWTGDGRGVGAGNAAAGAERGGSGGGRKTNVLGGEIPSLEDCMFSGAGRGGTGAGASATAGRWGSPFVGPAGAPNIGNLSQSISNLATPRRGNGGSPQGVTAGGENGPGGNGPPGGAVVTATGAGPGGGISKGKSTGTGQPSGPPGDGQTPPGDDQGSPRTPDGQAASAGTPDGQTARAGSPGGSASSGGGGGNPGPPLPPLLAGRQYGKRPTPVTLSGLIGNRDWIIQITCEANAAVLRPTGQRFALTELNARPTGEHPLAQAVRQLVARRQATVRPGEAPYRPLLRLQVGPGGLGTFYAVCPLLEPLRLPLAREGVN